MVDPISRREFTVASALALLGGVAITVAGCGSSTSPTSPNGNASNSMNVNGVVSANHGHSATVTSAQITAGNQLSLDIRGSANHPHTVELSSADLVQIGNGQRVSKTASMNQTHVHTVTFN